MKIKEILKNTAILGGGKGISQGLILAASPLLTRIYSPEDFGILAVFGALLGIIGGLSCLRYENAIPLAQDETEAANVGALSVLILCIVVTALCAFILVFGDNLSDWLNTPGLKPYLWLLPIGVFGAGMAQTGRFWAIRIKEFKRLAAAGVVSSIGVLAVQIGLGILRLGPAGLIFGRAFGIVCSAVVLFPLMRKNVRPLIPRVSRRGIAEAAKQHHQFLLYFAPSSGINSIGREIPIIFLSFYFGPAITGLYALTRRTLNLPTILISEQVRKVYYSYAADEKRDGNLRQLTKSIFKSLVQIALPGTIILGIIAPELFGFVFGERWTESGVYAQWICPWIFMTFICSPLTRLPMIMDKQGQELAFQIILLIMRALALIIGGIAQDVTVAFGLFGAVSFLCWFGFLVWSMHLVEIGPVEILRILFREMAIAIPIVAPLILAKFVFLAPDEHLWVLAASVGCALAAALVLIVRARHFIFPRVAHR